MALDGIFLRHIKHEIENEILGSRVNQIYQPNRDELVLVLRGYSGSKKLLLSARANSPRVNFTEHAPENPAQPPMFCMLLRKRLGGGKLTAVRQLECDRVLFLDFDCINELGEQVPLTVALKRVDLTVSSKRLILPNIKYELPEAQDKLNILTSEPSQIAERICSLPAEMPLSKAVLSSIQGISPIIGREVGYRVCEGATNRLEGVLYDKLITEIGRLKALVEKCSGTPCTVYREDGKPMDISFLPITQYGGFMRTENAESFNSSIDNFYDERDRQDRMRVKTHSLTKLLQNLRDRTARKLQKQHTELSQCADREQLRICGDLLQANLYRIERGASFADVENYYDENGGTLRIKLNPAISPAANAQKYYKDYQKAKNAESFLTDQLKKGESELEYLDSVLDEVSRAETERELSQIREELTDQGYLRAPKGRQPKQSALPPMSFESSDGFRIYVGRNNRQNDLLTLKTAAKTDIWLHTKEIHGSHVIISAEGRQVSDTAIIEAARLAAYHSKARTSSNVPVDYTLVKHVSKPSGAKPGMVIYVNNRTVYVDPSESVRKS